MTDMIDMDEFWYSPVNVIYHFTRLDSELPEQDKQSKVFRKAEEAFATAIMLMGIRKIQNIEYWLQIVKDSEGSPDIRSICFPSGENKLNMFKFQDVEVAIMEQHSKQESVVDFLKRTKLSRGKAYSDKTTILCKIELTTKLQPYKTILEELKEVKSKSPVILLGKVSPDKPVYRICQVHPCIDLLTTFNIKEEGFNKSHRGVLSLRRGSAKKLEFEMRPNEKHYPFESLGFKSI